jgi:integrase
MENQIDVLSTEQLKAVLKAADNLRDKVMIGLGVETACRVEEMRYWRPNNFDFRFLSAVKWDIKKKEARRVGITGELAEQVKLYINTTKLKGSSPLFPGRDPSKALSVKKIDKVLKDWTKAAGIEGWITWHDLRHTYVSIASMRNITIDEVMNVTGDSVGTIMRYYKKPIPQDQGKWLSDIYR